MFTEEMRSGAIARLSSGMSKNDTSRFAMVDKDGKIFPGNTACHGALAGDCAISMKRLAVVTAALQWPMRNTNLVIMPPMRIQYLDYLMNRSPYAAAFIDKDAAKCVADDAIAITGAVPSNQMAAACVATRSMWERRGLLCYLFCKLSDAGVNENLALLLANLATLGGEAEDIPTVRWNRVTEDHHPVCPLAMDWACVHNFLSGKMARPNRTWIEDYHYRGLNSLFLSYKSEPKSSGQLHQFIMANYGKGPAAAAPYNNPFPKPQPVTSATVGKFEPLSEAIANMVAFVKTTLEPKLKETAV